MEGDVSVRQASEGRLGRPSYRQSNQELLASTEYKTSTLRHTIDEIDER
jgi:hypothetical protein